MTIEELVKDPFKAYAQDAMAVVDKFVEDNKPKCIECGMSDVEADSYLRSLMWGLYCGVWAKKNF